MFTAIGRKATSCEGDGAEELLSSRNQQYREECQRNLTVMLTAEIVSNPAELNEANSGGVSKF